MGDIDGTGSYRFETTAVLGHAGTTASEETVVQDIGPVTQEDFQGTETLAWWQKIQAHPIWSWIVILSVFLGLINGLFEFFGRIFH